MSFNCKLCNESLTEEEEAKNLQLHGVCVCDRCAMSVANAYESWHGGVERWGFDKQTCHRIPEISHKKRWKIFKRDGYACVSCGSDSDLTIDHAYPKSKGGTNDEENLRTMCRSCNSSKGAKTI